MSQKSIVVCWYIKWMYVCVNEIWKINSGSGNNV